jgi:hypothetical protein
MVLGPGNSDSTWYTSLLRLKYKIYFLLTTSFNNGVHLLPICNKTCHECEHDLLVFFSKLTRRIAWRLDFRGKNHGYISLCLKYISSFKTAIWDLHVVAGGPFGKTITWVLRIIAALRGIYNASPLESRYKFSLSPRFSDRFTQRFDSFTYKTTDLPRHNRLDFLFEKRKDSGNDFSPGERHQCKTPMYSQSIKQCWGHSCRAVLLGSQTYNSKSMCLRHPKI